MEGDLLDDQIEELLARATARLQQKATTQELATSRPKQHFNFPKLDTGKVEKPYISSKGDVATVDAKRLLEEKQRKQANTVRKVEDPVTAKKTALEVSSAPISGTQAPCYEENFPNLHLERSPGAVLVSLSASLRAIQYHSYSDTTALESASLLYSCVCVSKC